MQDWRSGPGFGSAGRYHGPAGSAGVDRKAADGNICRVGGTGAVIADENRQVVGGIPGSPCPYVAIVVAAGHQIPAEDPGKVGENIPGGPRGIDLAGRVIGPAASTSNYAEVRVVVHAVLEIPNIGALPAVTAEFQQVLGGEHGVGPFHGHGLGLGRAVLGHPKGDAAG